jgi:hypothetical protein
MTRARTGVQCAGADGHRQAHEGHPPGEVRKLCQAGERGGFVRAGPGGVVAAARGHRVVVMVITFT